MTAAVVVLAIAAAAAIAGSIAQLLAYRSAQNARVQEAKAAADKLDEIRAVAAEYKSQRDSFAVDNAAYSKRIGELESLLRSATAQRDEAIKTKVRSKAEEIRNARDAQAGLSLLNDVVSGRDKAPGETGTAAGGDGDGADGVPSAASPR